MGDILRDPFIPSWGPKQRSTAGIEFVGGRLVRAGSLAGAAGEAHPWTPGNSYKTRQGRPKEKLPPSLPLFEISLVIQYRLRPSFFVTLLVTLVLACIFIHLSAAQATP